MTLNFTGVPAGVLLSPSSISATEETRRPFTRHTASPSRSGVAVRNGLSLRNSLTITPRPTNSSPAPHKTPAEADTIITPAISKTLLRVTRLCVR